jgi:hypothetical protein
MVHLTPRERIKIVPYQQLRARKAREFEKPGISRERIAALSSVSSPREIPIGSLNTEGVSIDSRE